MALADGVSVRKASGTGVEAKSSLLSSRAALGRRPPDALEQRRAAYVLALFGAPQGDELTASQRRAAASLLTGVSILREHRSAFPTVAMLSVEWFAKRVLTSGLEKLHAKPLPMTSVRTPNCTGHKTRWKTLSLTYSILAIWSLEQFHVVLYLDTDVAVVRSLDHVLLYMLRSPALTEMRSAAGCAELAQDPAASSPVEHCMQRSACYNTGVWAVRPNQSTFERLLRYLEGGRSPCGNGFQMAAHHFWSTHTCGGRADGHDCVDSNWESLPGAGYNLKHVCLGGHWTGSLPTTLRGSDIFVVHWSGASKAPELVRQGQPSRRHQRTYRAVESVVLNATRDYAATYDQMATWMAAVATERTETSLIGHVSYDTRRGRGRGRGRGRSWG